MNPIAGREQFVIDAEGKRIGVLLDLETYERLVEAWEDAEDQRLYDEAAPQAHAELARGETVTLDEYLAGKRTP
jgi:hypothetical protein